MGKTILVAAGLPYARKIIHELGADADTTVVALTTSDEILVWARANGIANVLIVWVGDSEWDWRDAEDLVADLREEALDPPVIVLVGDDEEQLRNSAEVLRNVSIFVMGDGKGLSLREHLQAQLAQRGLLAASAAIETGVEE